MRRRQIKIGNLRKLKIPFPPLYKQQLLEIKLEKLILNSQSLESNYQQTISRCEKMKKTVLAKAFNGKL